MSAFAELLGETTPDWPAGLPEHLSASSLKMYLRCREQFRRRYVLGEKERPGAALAWGSAHNFALVETNFDQKIRTGEDLPVDDVQLAFAEGLDLFVDRNGGEGEVEWGGDKPGEIKDKGVEVAAAYHRAVSPTVQPVAVEEWFEIEVPGVPVAVHGRLDVVESGRVIDLKTGGKKEMKPDNVFQGRIYQLRHPLPVEFHLSTKTKVPGVYTPAEHPEFGLEINDLVVERTRRMLRNLAADMVSTYSAFGPETPWPGAYTYGWGCQYCGFRPTCPWWAT